jgi:hypothetical protein
MGKNFDIPQGMSQNDITRRLQELERRISDARAFIDTTRLRLRQFLAEI